MQTKGTFYCENFSPKLKSQDTGLALSFNAL